MTSQHPPVELRSASFRELDAATLYALLKLRVDVFVVEQKCPYPELDGRDLEPGTRHLWLSRADAPVAYLRVLAEPGGVNRIGRVAVAPDRRGGGLAGRLMTEALAVVGDRPTVLDAQAHLAGWYARYGYVAEGEEFLEDGIPHLRMARPGVTELPPVG
ncbi:GNAT family N-acetyltransferase [Rhizomonospora bruguierae]|uniref:GNAT family N-acetyltransferase n=1 Tax=Rhizomonospora bruguierae TaxID=1581705 RepID=UPI001BD0B8E5|nr:GNAT family N-acetyltransferase [Micromonospora sp. NBRC 107566]